MALYPQNRVYIIFPASLIVQHLGDVVDVARYSNDGKYCVWDFDQNDPNLEALRAVPELQFYSHNQIREVMASPNWKFPE